jgi:hypothetical protein
VGCLFSFAPSARADITINITESSADTITYNTGGLNVTQISQMLTSGEIGWIIDTTKFNPPAGGFTFAVPQTIGPNFYFQEPDPHFLNRVSVTDKTQLTIVSDQAITGVPFANNKVPQKIGVDTLGNDVVVVFDDTLTPDPSDAPEPRSLFLVGSGALLLFATQQRRILGSGLRPTRF